MLEPNRKQTDWAQVLTLASAGIAATIGIVVVVGWTIGSEPMIAIRRNMIPVQMNTALGFLACALALLAILSGRRWIATAATSGVALLAGCTGVKFITGVRLATDTFFLNKIVADHISGDMAPNTVVAFLCVTVAITMLAWRERIAHAPEVAASLSAFVVAVGSVALTGYLAGIPTAYEWRPGKPIALLTTIAFAAIGMGTMSLAWRGSGHDQRRWPRWLPLPLFVLLMSVCAMMAKSMWDTSRIAILAQPRRSLVFCMVLTLVFGTAVSVALVSVIRLAEAASRRALDLEALTRTLAASEERYRSLTVATAQVIWTTNPDGLVVGDMPTWREFTGATLEQLQGWGWLDSLHPDDRDKTARVWADAVERRALYEIEYRLRRRDGEYRDVWVRGVPVLNGDGSIREWVGTSTDITERKRSQQQLRLAQERLALALEAGASGTFEWEFSTNVVSWSREIERLYGVAQGGFGGTYTAWEALVFPEDLPQARAAIAAARDTGQFVSEWRIRRPSDGEVRWIGAQARILFDTTQQPQRMIGINLDITERKAAEEALRHYAAELQRSNTELQEFAFVASHDLQEPLRKIMAFSERLKDRAAGQLDEVSLDYMNRMHNAAVRMGALIDSLLEYSRVTTRALPFDEVDLAAMMPGILADLEECRKKSRSRIVVQTLPKVQGDPVQLRQLFQNLLVNALKFHAPGVPPLVRITAHREDDRWRIAVADNGIGFDLAYTEKIFKPFQRLHGRNEYEGSGMGLAICRKIAQRHGSNIDVVSAPGQGATFTVSLPAATREDGTKNEDGTKTFEECGVACTSA